MPTVFDENDFPEEFLLACEKSWDSSLIVDKLISVSLITHIT
jgi:hypothetical protein